ncbi:ATP-binding protein [Streptomyces sp. M19]
MPGAGRGRWWGGDHPRHPPGRAGGVPARADRAAAVRRLVAARLTRWRLEETAEIAVLATNELFANAVEYGSAGPGARVTVTLRCGDRELRVEVTDSSRPAHAARGRGERGVGAGLAIVDTLASGWGPSRQNRAAGARRCGSRCRSRTRREPAGRGRTAEAEGARMHHHDAADWLLSAAEDPGRVRLQWASGRAWRTCRWAGPSTSSEWPTSWARR